jgi:tRNA uridine 5-carboxymethylaminomethyl modification enzyme
LINKGTDEPYRMFTSRAEYRTLLRQDNADVRLTARGHLIGLASDERLINVQNKIRQANELIEEIKVLKVNPADVNEKLESFGTAALREKVSLWNLLRRPNIEIPHIRTLTEETEILFSKYSDEVLEQVEINVKYESYIEKEQLMVNKLQRLENLNIPTEFDYMKLKTISIEGRQKLTKIRPQTIGMASRISGVSVSDISVLMVYIGR